MKINEIATNEGLEKLLPRIFGNGAKVAKSAGRMEPSFGPLQSAANAGQAELGGIKATDNLLTPAEHSALFPQTTTGSTGAKPKPRADTSAYDQEVLNRHDLNPGMPNKGKPSSDAEKYLELKQAQAARTAAEKQAAVDDLARQVSPGAEPSMTSSRPPSTDSELPPMTAGPRPISPGAKRSKTSGGRQEPSMNQPAAPANGINLSKDEVLDLIKNKPGSAAAQAAAKEAGLDKNPGNMFTRNPWKTGIVAASLPDLYNQFSPPTATKLPYTPGEAAADLVTYAGKNFMANHGKAGVDKVVPNTTNNKSDNDWTPPLSQDAVDKAKDTNPEHQAAISDIERWNQDHPDNPIKEGYTNELNRIVFLSRP